MKNLNKNEQLNITGGILMTPLIKFMLVKSVISRYIKYRFK